MSGTDDSGRDTAKREPNGLAEPHTRPRHRRSWGGRVTLGIVLATAGAVLAWRAGAFSPATSSGTGRGAPAPATAAVTRQDLSATTPVTASLGYADSYLVRSSP